MRTSLNRAPLPVSADELAGRQHAFERELWFKYRAIVVRLGAPSDLPRLVTMALEAHAKARFERKDRQ